MDIIRNIYCVGRNYALHAKELHNEIPTEPMFFSKPTHAVIEANGQSVMLPGNRGAVHYETEFVIQIGRPFSKGISVDQLISNVAVGLDLTLRDVQSQLKEKRHPWLLAKGFPCSAVLSRFIAFPGIDECRKLDFSMIKNGSVVQRGNINDMIFDLNTIVTYAAENYGLDEGDIIFTGTPEGVGEILNGDQFSLLLGNQILGNGTFALK